MQATRIHLPARLALLPCLAVLASCGDGEPINESTLLYTSRYPTLAAHASMDEEDFNRYLRNADRGTDITPDSIKSLSVGSSINSAASTFNLRPIFNLGQLTKDNRLNVDTTGSLEKTELRLTSNKTASSASSQRTIDASASGSYAGFKAAGAYHQANAWQNTNSDGSISVQMVSANTNNVVTLLSSGFTGADNLTPYLIGIPLTDDQLRGYVAITESTPSGLCGGQPYITRVTVSHYKLADTEPYANIQILARMESIFSRLKAQHALCTDPSIQALLLTQMTDLRGKIVHAIADFYAFNGDSFVSKTISMNQGIGKGQLSFSNASGNTEAQYGASLSVQYQTLNVGVGGSGSFQYYKQNGWATALQNVQVSAESMPAGVADTSAWVGSLSNMLKDEAKSEVPPMGSLPKDPGVKLPEPVGDAHALQEPPDSAFTSYAQWKQYQQDKKSANDEDELERQRQRVDSESISIDDGDWLLQAGQGDAYLQLITELDDLKERAKQPPKPPQAGDERDSNLVRFDKMYVNGFETLPYDAVIPQLRPNLDIPGVSKGIGSFPNLMEIMLVTEKLGRLDSYLRFLANMSAVSNVTPEMSMRYHQFFLKASARAYDLVALVLGQGADLTPSVLNGYKRAMLGTASTRAKSELYTALQDMDYYDYVHLLLEPERGRAWTAAPGGYLPLRWNANGEAQLLTWNTLKTDGDDVTAVDFGNPNADPLSLYRGAKAIQTPWYPVYIFNQASAPVLVFVQHFGAYQVIHGANWTVKPIDWMNQSSTDVTPALNPKYPQYQVLGGESTYPLPFPYPPSKPMREVVAGRANSFLNHMSWAYSVNFPQSGSDPMRLRKFNALILAPQPSGILDLDYMIRGNTFSVALRYVSDATLDHYADASYSAFRPRNNPSARRLVRRMDTGAIVDIAQDMPGGEAYVMLLPLNAMTGGDSLQHAFNYAPERSALDIVSPSSLDLINKLAVLLE